MDWEVGWRFKRKWTYLYLWLLHTVIWQKPTHYCRAIILQLKVDKLKKKSVSGQPGCGETWLVIPGPQRGLGVWEEESEGSARPSKLSCLHDPALAAPSSHLGGLSIRMVAGKQILEDEATQQRKGHTLQRQVWNMPSRDHSEVAAASVKRRSLLSQILLPQGFSSVLVCVFPQAGGEWDP